MALVSSAPLLKLSLRGLQIAGIFASIAIFYVLAYYYLASRRPKNFPPGPKTLPFLGNLHQFPPTKAFLKFQELGQQYGSIIGMKLGPQNVVILNDYRHVQELFDKKGGIYSDRPLNHIANDLIYQNRTHLLFMPYGDEWRNLRKTVQDMLRVKTVDALLPIQNAEAAQTLFHLLEKPDGWYDHIRRYSSAVILASVYGLRGATFDSPRVKELYHVQDRMTAITEVGATPPIDIFPVLKLLPDFVSPWRKWAQSIRTEQRRFYFSLAAECKENLQRPDAPDCFLQKLMAEAEKSGLDDEHIAYLAGTLMEAGSDTTASTLLSFLLALAKHPEVLKKCQAEVDALCGTERSPNVEDFEKLPYIKAVMTETLRWRPVAAGGVPHATTQDDFYEGYFIPKGTMLFANAWAIHRTNEFAAPETFDPERFVKNKFGIQGEQADQASDKRRVLYGFGAGRRVCSGQRLAENSLIVNMAKVCWGFDIVAGEGEIDDGVADGYYGGFLICPKKFPLKITPRSNRHAEVIKQEYEAEIPFLSRYKA